MAGGLRATVRQTRFDVTLSDDRILVRSGRVVAPAIHLFKLRRALRRARLPQPLLPVALSLGRLPTIQLSL